jgi:hypothetical protein
LSQSGFHRTLPPSDPRSADARFHELAPHRTAGRRAILALAALGTTTVMSATGSPTDLAVLSG